MNNFKFKLCLIIFLPFFLATANSAKILSVYATYSKSHLIFAQNFLKHLANKGHEVTVVSPFPMDKPIANYKEMFIPIPAELKSNMDEMVLKQPSILRFLDRTSNFMELALRFGNQSINTPAFKKLMKEESFDLIILPLFLNDFQYGLAAHFKCPLVVISSIGNSNLVSSLVGNPQSVAASPNVFLGYKTPMTFWQRVKNFGMFFFESGMKKYFIYKSETFYNSNFPPDKYPSFLEARNNLSLLLVNHHFSEGALRPTVSNLIDVGGLQTKEKPDPLPEKIKKWIDTAEHGVILFSFGSNLASSGLSEDKLKIILNTFAKVKQRVLFKWETDYLPVNLSNVMTSKWMPQYDILAQKNVKLFITHGGMGSVVEAKFNNVPIIGIPFFGDQKGNVAAAVEEGWALQVDFVDINEAKLSVAIDEILTNPKYLKTVQSISTLYRDRPMSAVDTATYWVEYVMRHKGAPHMRFPGIDMNFFQNHSLDVIAFLGVVLYLVGKFVWFLVFLVKCACCSAKSKLGSNKKLKTK